MALVNMLIICWTLQNGELREAWRIENPTPQSVCWMMNQTMTGGGPKGVITVKCSERTKP